MALYDAVRWQDRRDAIVTELKEIAEGNSGDPEIDHRDADKLLLALIDDEEVTRIFDAIRKWYS